MLNIDDYSLKELQEAVRLKIKQDNKQVIKKGFLKETWYSVIIKDSYISGDEFYCSESELNDIFSKEIVMPKGTRFIAYTTENREVNYPCPKGRGFLDTIWVNWRDDIGLGFDYLSEDWAEKYLENIREIKD
ncbi:MAG: hypothetical protein ACFFG0_19105 [Candidatus Thorarchaeota archaeon]